MQVAGVPGLRLEPALILFVILPGLVFTKAYIFANRKSDTLSRWDKIGFVLGGTILSGLIWVLIYRFGLDGGELTAVSVSSINVLQLLLSAISQSAIALFLGLVLGGFRYNMSNGSYRTFKHREDPWEYVISEIRDEYVQIETLTGSNVEGLVARYESGNGNGDILISQVGPSKEQTFPTGDESNAVYVSADSVGQIHFIDSDSPNEIPDFPSGDSDFSEEKIRKAERLEAEKEREERESDLSDTDSESA